MGSDTARGTTGRAIARKSSVNDTGNNEDYIRESLVGPHLYREKPTPTLKARSTHEQTTPLQKNFTFDPIDFTRWCWGFSTQVHFELPVPPPSPRTQKIRRNTLGQVPSAVVLDAIRGRLTAPRLALVRAAFSRLASKGKGHAAGEARASDVAEGFHSQRHPEVIAGRRLPKVRRAKKRATKIRGWKTTACFLMASILL